MRTSVAMTSGHVRPLQRKDLDAVAALRLRCFRYGRHPDSRVLAEHLHTVFLANPWCDYGIESLIFQTDEGQILGFAGLVGRPMRFGGEPLLAAISSQTMVDPDARHQGIAVALLRASLEGPQDLLFADLANPAYGRLLEQVGGVTIPELRLQWRYPLRTLRWATGLMDTSPALKWSLRVSRPILDALDMLAARASARAWGDGAIPPATEPLTTAMHCQLLDRLQEHYDLSPDYDQNSLAWTLCRLGEGLSGSERLEARHVVGPSGDTDGFFVAAVRPGKETTVLQLGTTGSEFHTTLAGVLELARENKCMEIKGRVQPDFLAHFATPPSSLSLSQSRVMMASDKPELIDCIRAGRAWLTPLDGELSLGF